MKPIQFRIGYRVRVTNNRDPKTALVVKVSSDGDIIHLDKPLAGSLYWAASSLEHASKPFII